MSSSNQILDEDWQNDPRDEDPIALALQKVRKGLLWEIGGLLLIALLLLWIFAITVRNAYTAWLADFSSILYVSIPLSGLLGWGFMRVIYYLSAWWRDYASGGLVAVYVEVKHKEQHNNRYTLQLYDAHSQQLRTWYVEPKIYERAPLHTTVWIAWARQTDRLLAVLG